MISSLWDSDSAAVSQYKLKQVIVLAGNGNMNKPETTNELREFFSKIDLDTMLRYIEDAISEEKEDKFTERGFVLQDLVNEMGLRLGYKVTNGLYHGKRNKENGFDGLWEAPDGSHIIMESKTSDAYTLDLEAIVGYRDDLIEKKKISRKKSSILIVLGRADKGTFPSLIKGSNFAQDVRIISTRALFELLRTSLINKNDTTSKQIFRMLKPHDFMQLDNLVELVFPQTDENIPDIEEEEHDTESFEYYGKQEIPELPDMTLKVGAFIKLALNRLADSGYRFSDEQIKLLCDKQWSKKTFNTNWPFFKLKSKSGTTNLCDAAGRTRYWTKAFVFGEYEVFVTKELFEKDHNKDFFITWYESLEEK